MKYNPSMKKLFLLLLLSLGLTSISYAAKTIITIPERMTDSQLRGWLSGVSSWRYDYQKALRDDKAAKDRGSWIKKQASAFAQENPGLDAPNSGYWATDGCGEGKQPANASCDSN